MVVRWMAQGTNVFRRLFVQLNPAFQVRNMKRDINATVFNLPGAKNRTFLPIWWESINDLWDAEFKGKQVPDLDKMLEQRSLVSFDQINDISREEQAYEKVLMSWNADANLWERQVDGPLRSFFYKLNVPYRLVQWYTRTAERTGRITERSTKLAAQRYLERKFPDMHPREIAHIVRNFAGTPNITKKGQQAWLWNNMVLYSNVWKENWNRDIQVARRIAQEEGKMAYAQRILYRRLPASLFTMAVLAGLFGRAMREEMEKIPKYDRANHWVFPLWTRADGRVVYLRMPIDESTRFLHNIVLKLYDSKNTDLSQNLSGYLAGDLPNLNPMLGMLWDLRDYVAGRNPYDEFRDRRVIDKHIFNRADFQTDAAFAGHLSNSMGLGILHRFQPDKNASDRKNTEVFFGIPILEPFFNSFIKVSDVGLAQEAMHPLARELEKYKSREHTDLQAAWGAMIDGEPLTPDQAAVILRNGDKLQRMEQRWIGNIYGTHYERLLMRASSNRELREAMERVIAAHQSGVRLRDAVTGELAEIRLRAGEE
jgi:hypothetical protein